MTVESFISRLQRCGVEPGSRVLSAVSGGADSVALLRLLCAASEAMRLTVLCAHVEHGIRGGASREDEAFVRALCGALGVPLYVAHVDAPAAARARGTGIEDAARSLRYAFLDETARDVRADCVALAHHRGDQAETVLLHAARGCDLRGLCAMRQRSGRYVRPLLDCPPQELRAYLTRIGQTWREDGTNADVRYARNRVRLLVLPELERACPGAQRALARLSKAAQRDEDYFARQLRALEQPQRFSMGLICELLPLRSLHEAVLGRFIARMVADCCPGAQGAETVEAVCAAALAGREATVNLARGAHACVGKRFLCVRRGGLPPPPSRVAPLGETKTPYGVLHLRKARAGETGDGVRAQAIPARLLCGATVGPPASGERMALFGGGHALVQKILGESGAERAIRSGMPVLRAADGEVLWLPGVRAGAPCRVLPGEEAVMACYEGFSPVRQKEGRGADAP